MRRFGLMAVFAVALVSTAKAAEPAHVGPRATPTAAAAPGAVPVVPATPPAFSVKGAAGSGVTLEVNKIFSVNVKTRMLLRYSLDVPGEDAAGKREVKQLAGIQTARLWVSGYAYRPELTYLLQLALAARDYRDGATSPLYDAYIDWKPHRDFNLRAGQYFVPFDRVRTHVAASLLLVERTRVVNELTLDRDVGVMAYSNTFLHPNSPVAWRLGVFSGGGNNRTEFKKPGALVVGRLELRPLGPIDDQFEGDIERHEKPVLALGTGFGANINTNRSRSTTGATYVGGTTDYLHAAADLIFKWRGFSFATEYVWRRASVDRLESLDATGKPVTEYTRSGQGWLAQLGYDSPWKLGAVARLARTSAEAGTDPKFIAESATSGQEYAVGLNYYIHGHSLKLQATWLVRTTPSFAQKTAENISHLQMDATF